MTKLARLHSCIFLLVTFMYIHVYSYSYYNHSVTSPSIYVMCCYSYPHDIEQARAALALPVFPL